MQKPPIDGIDPDDIATTEINANPSTALSDEEHDHPLRKLIVFQFKLAFDAIRDILLSPVSIVATILDIAQNRKGENSYFGMLMKFGRNSEARINLFDQHRGESQTVDNLFNQVEEVLRKQYEKGGISKKTKQEIEAKFKLK